MRWSIASTEAAEELGIEKNVRVEELWEQRFRLQGDKRKTRAGRAGLEAKP
jgi:hypothetical protein